MEKKKVLIGVLIVILVVLAIIMVVGNKKEKNEENLSRREEKNIVQENVKELENGTKVNTSEELAKNKTLEGLEITNMQLKENGGISKLVADVKNPTQQDKESMKVKVEILDETGKTVVTLKGKIDPVKAGKTVKLNMAVTADVVNAHDFRITKE